MSNKYISPHLNKLYNTTILSKDIIKITQTYLLPDINKIKQIKKRYNTDLILKTLYICFIYDKFHSNYKYRKIKDGSWWFK